MFTGTFPALVTPFKNAPQTCPEVDYNAWEALIEWQIKCGVEGIVIYGSTGEAATLSKEEKLEITKRTVQLVKRRIQIIAGTGSNNTRDSIELTKKVKELGVDAALAVSPYYNKPTQEGLYQHFTAIAEEGGLPVIVYNIPARSVVEISTATFARLAKHPGIVAVKQSVDSIAKLIELAEVANDQFTILAGDDPIIYGMMVVGGKGTISASASVFPEKIKAIVDAGLKGDWTACLKLQCQALPYINALFSETNPIPAKAALKLMGKIPNDTMRLPLVSASEKTKELLRSLL